MDSKIEKTTNILANLVTVIEKRGDYNLDNYSKKIAALYSSQEPQKSEKQKVADLLGVPLSEVHTLDIQDGKLVEIVDVPQSVSTPTEGMELSEKLTPSNNATAILPPSQEIIEGMIEIVIDQYKRAEKDERKIENLKRQLAKVLANLPTEQDTRIKNLEIQLKNWQDFYVADVKPSTFEQEIREKTQDKIARDLYKIIADNNYDMASVIRYLDKIVKLKSGQSPKEV